MHSVLSLIHPLKTLHGSIPLKQMESFLRMMSSSRDPELTPDMRNNWKLSEKGSRSNEDNSFPDVRDLAESIPKGQDGIDIAEFEDRKVVDKDTGI